MDEWQKREGNAEENRRPTREIRVVEGQDTAKRGRADAEEKREERHEHPREVRKPPPTCRGGGVKKM